LRAASGMRAGVGDKGAVRRDPRLVALERLLVELRRAEIPADRGQVSEAEPLRAEACVTRPVVDHVVTVPVAQNARENPSNLHPHGQLTRKRLAASLGLPRKRWV